MSDQTVSSDYAALQSQITRLNQIGVALSSEHNLSKLLEQIVTETRQFTRADGGSLYIKEGNRLNFLVAQTESLEKKTGKLPFKSFYIPLTTESVAGFVAATGTIVNIPDAYQLDPGLPYQCKKDFDLKTGYRTKSILAVPMRDHRGETMGVLQLINSTDANGDVIPFRKEYEDLVLSLASQAAVAVRNARLIEEVRNLFRSLVRYSAKAIDARSPHTAGHSGRVTKFSVLLAQAVDREKDGRFGAIHFTAEEIEELRMAGWLHDIGKIGVKEAVLEKGMKLNEWQMEKIAQTFETIKSHYIIRAQGEKLSLISSANSNADMLQKIDVRLQGELGRAQDDWAFLQRINTPGFLPPEDINRLRGIAEQSYTDTAGQTRFILTPYEHESLGVIRGNLTASEFKEIQRHVHQTILILEKIPFTKALENVPRYAAMHHEKLDGSGYPKGLKGDAIPIQPRMLCIADIYEALTAADRPYKKVTPHDIALKILQEEAKAGKLDGDLVELVCSKNIFGGVRKEEED